MQVYNYLLEKLTLTKKHKQELKEKRGFSDETIAQNKFVSGGSYIVEFENELISKFSESDLLKSGLTIHNGKTLQINPQLLQDRVIIPYLDKDDNCYLLRPHKLGLSGVPVAVYQVKNISHSIILTEGEFKAAAGCQYGYQTVAIPGISSFSEKNFPLISKLFHEHGVRKIIILFDSECKDDPKFSTYKENPNNRYDTQFYAYYMAKRLDTEGFETRIASFPVGWRVDGKIDLDGALAQGRSKENLRTILQEAKTSRQFLADLEGEEKRIILRKNAQKRYKSFIRREFNHYVVTRVRGKQEYDEVISNFTIKILSTHETPEGIMREIVFINEYGDHSRSFSLGPEHMGSADAFATFCYSKGNFIWRGTREDLSNIWEGEFVMDDGRHIIEPDHIGWVASEKMWLFGNVGFMAGKALRPDKNHVFWLERKGIKPIALGVSSGRSIISEGIPYLNVKKFDLLVVKDRLSESIGKYQASLALGWVSAIVYMEETFDACGCFPFLFITGRRGSGKSTVAEWLMNFFGLENAGKMASDTTQVGLQRYLSYYSSLPVFVDEYRNTKDIVRKNGFLRNCYNRQSAGKGIKSSFGVREAKIRGTLLLSGEETPEDNALLTRCIPILITEKNRLNNHFNWFMSNRVNFSYHIYNLIQNRQVDHFKGMLTEGKDFFAGQGVDDRIATNYAIVAAGYSVAFGKGDLDFTKWVTQETQRVKQEYEEEQAVSSFLEDLLSMKTRKLIDNSYWTCDGLNIYLYFRGLYILWAQDYRKTRGVEPFKSSSIRDYLKEEPGFVGFELKWIGNQAHRCIVFDKSKAPDAIQYLVSEENENVRML